MFTCAMRLQSCLFIGMATLFALPAVEVPVWDVGVVAEARPGDFSFAWQRDGVTRRGDDTFDRAVAAGVAVRRGLASPGAGSQWLLGGELLWLDEAYGVGGRRGVLLRGEAGWGFGCAPDLVLGATLTAGVGRAEFRLPGGIFGDASLPGTLWEGGPRLLLRWNPGERLALIGTAGWLIGRDHHAGDGIVLDLDRSGGWLALGAAWIIDPEPRRVLP